MRRNHRPCETGRFTTSCSSSPSRPRTCWRPRVEAGAEIPFEVAESPGARSVLYRYRPLSAEFVRERFTELKSMPGFGAAADALARIEGMSGYLRVMGASYVPAAERDRAEAALERFLGRVWEDSSTFELDVAALRARVPRARVDRLRGHRRQHRARARRRRRDRRRALGARAPASTLVRGDLVDAPPEAVWGGGRERRGAAHARDADRGVAAQRAAAADRGARRLPEAAHRAAPAEVRRRRARLDGLVAHRRRPLADGAARVRPGASRGARYWLEEPERPELAELFELAARASRARRLAAVGAGALRARLRAAASRSRGSPTTCLRCARCSTAASRTRRRDGAAPGGAVRGAGAPRRPSRRRVEQAFSLERLVMRGDVDAAYLQAIGVASPDAGRARARGQPARAAARHGLRPPGARPDAASPTSCCAGAGAARRRASRRPSTPSRRPPTPEPPPEPRVRRAPQAPSAGRGRAGHRGSGSRRAACARCAARTTSDWGLDDDAARLLGRGLATRRPRAPASPRAPRSTRTGTG